MVLRLRKPTVQTKILNRPCRGQQPKMSGKFMDSNLQGNRRNIKDRCWWSGSGPLKLETR